MTDKAPKKTDLMSEAERDAYHAEKMRKKKEARNKILATKTEERGLLIVHTGKGKGKSTAAFGMVFRAIGHGFKVGVVQFVKGAWSTGERDVLDRFPDQVTIKAMGEASPGTPRTASATSPRPAAPGDGQGTDRRRKLQAHPARRTQYRAALRLPAARRSAGGAEAQATRHACHRHRAQCQGRSHRTG
jgi:hypothetical protein